MSEKEWINIFGDNLRDMMYEYGYSQREFADALGLAESTVSRYLNKQMAPNIFTIINISHVLNCTIDELVDFGSRIK